MSIYGIRISGLLHREKRIWAKEINNMITKHCLFAMLPLNSTQVSMEKIPIFNVMMYLAIFFIILTVVLVFIVMSNLKK
jgi:hypothetical protein